PNTCLVSENFAALYKGAAGDTISIQGPNGPVPLTELGVVQEYTWARGAVLGDRAVFADAFDDRLIDMMHVFLKAGPGEAEARKQVKAASDREALAVLTRAEVNEYLVNFIKRMYTLAYLQQLAVGIVAALGVVMALLISVLQRRRELG